MFSSIYLINYLIISYLKICCLYFIKNSIKTSLFIVLSDFYVIFVKECNEGRNAVYHIKNNLK